MYKRSKKTFIIILCATVIYTLAFPIPIRINRTMPAIRSTVGERDKNFAECSVEINGTYYFYLFRADKYIGQFFISDEMYTSERGAQLQTAFVGSVNSLTYSTDDGYITPGIICSSTFLKKMLIGLDTYKDNNDIFSKGQVFICAPAESIEDAHEIIEQLTDDDEYLSTIEW